MELYGCCHHEWLRCPQHDMHCLLMWGPHAMVIAFRGTQSMKNVRADAKARLRWGCSSVGRGE